MNTNLPANPETCPRCMVGRIKPQFTTYSNLVNGYLLSVPEFPCWVCDVCHAFMYDPVALNHLQTFLNAPQAAKKSQRAHSAAPTFSPAKRPTKKIS